MRAMRIRILWCRISYSTGVVIAQADGAADVGAGLRPPSRRSPSRKNLQLGSCTPPRRYIKTYLPHYVNFLRRLSLAQYSSTGHFFMYLDDAHGFGLSGRGRPYSCTTHHSDAFHGGSPSSCLRAFGAYTNSLPCVLKHDQPRGPRPLGYCSSPVLTSSPDTLTLARRP